MKKRILAALLCGVLAMSMLAGCGTKDTASQEAEETAADAVVEDTAADVTETEAAETEAAEAEEATDVPTEKVTIRVGTEYINELKILGKLYALALEDNGYPVKEVSGGGVKGLQNGSLDICVQLTGVALSDVLDGEFMTDAQEVYDYVSQQYKEQWNIVWLEPTQVEEKIGLIMRQDHAQELGITSLSDLQAQSAGLVLGELISFVVPENDLLRMDEYYGTFEYDAEEVDTFDLWGMLEDGNMDAGILFLNNYQKKLSEGSYVVLEEDIPVFPPQNIAPVIRGELLEQYPELEDILNRVSEQYTTERMQEIINAGWDTEEELQVLLSDFYETYCK